MRSIKFERLAREGKAGLVAKHGSAAYKPGITSAIYMGVNEHFGPILTPYGAS
jgi:hypothetical protein